MSAAIVLNATVSALMNPEHLGTDAPRVAKTIARMGQSGVDFLGAMITPSQVERMGQKARMHACFLASFITSGGTDLMGFSRAHAFVGACIALLPEGVRVSYADAHYLLGVSNKGAQANPIPGVSRARLMRFLGGSAGATGTITTRVSSTVGKNGLWGALGVTVKGDKHGFTVESRAPGFLVAYALALEQMTDGALRLLNDE